MTMDEQLRLHPFRSHAAPYELLCDVADRHGWKLRLRLVGTGSDAHTIKHDVVEHMLAAGRRLEVVLEGSGFTIREHDGSTLGELAAAVLEKVAWAVESEGDHRG
jgi:hypothetical protein